MDSLRGFTSEKSIYEIKGADLERRAEEVLTEVFSEVFNGDATRHKIVSRTRRDTEPIRGRSGTVWRPDVGVRNNRSNSYYVLVECKGIGKPKTWQYHAQVCSAYMELNDIRLNDLFADTKLYLIINRRVEKGDRQAYGKNYDEIFNTISVKVYYLADENLIDFATDLCETFRVEKGCG